MYKYKRGISKIDDAKSLAFLISNNSDTCFSTSATLDTIKPYNGMYIKKGKVLVGNIAEKIEFKDKVYKITQLNTSMQNISCDEYITSVCLMQNKFEYDTNIVKYSKQIAFKEDTDILCIEYVIENKENGQVKFKIIPMITYRELFNMKTAQFLKFNKRKVDSGVVINLSVMEQENLVIKSKELNYLNANSNVSNVKHEYINEDYSKKIYTEDLVIPCEFETYIKAKQTKKVRIYISTQDFNISDINGEDIFDKMLKLKDKVCENIASEYLELKNLALCINSFDMKESIVSNIPYQKEYNKIIYSNKSDYNLKELEIEFDELIDIVKAIEGKYLIFDRVKEANNLLVKIRRYIKDIDSLNIEFDEVYKKLILLKLWYIESVNRVLQKQNNIELFFDFTKEIIHTVIKSTKKKILYNDIELVALMYNAIKIYEVMLIYKNVEDLLVSDELSYIQILLEKKFWVEEKRIMKRYLSDTEVYANIQMIYTLSLSYPCVIADMPIKLLDTIFKELYTPYGLREISKNSIDNTGLIYPKYMAHFVKANLRQNGVTRASQKIAYNLAKELLLDIGKYVNGGVKKIYTEKGIAIDSVGVDLLTNAETIRLYSMLT